MSDYIKAQTMRVPKISGAQQLVRWEYQKLMLLVQVVLKRYSREISVLLQLPVAIC